MNTLDYDALNWDKVNGLIPAIIQDANSGNVLMLGYMNREALQITLRTNKITFFSRSKQKIWIKGETSRNFLNLVNISADCDNDTLLVMANPTGPTCHKGDETCFKHSEIYNWQVLKSIESIMSQRINDKSSASYTLSLLNDGIDKITQKIGEESIETIIAGLKESDDRLCNEVADLIYHTLVLLKFRQLSFDDVLNTLSSRLDASN